MFEQYIRSGRETLNHLRNYREIANSVKEIVRERYGEARVYAFGSVVEGKFTASSDIDILIVSDSIGREEGSFLKADILRRIGYSVPLQIHVATHRELTEWYLRFVGKIEEL